jgi:hypothetical protein
MTNLTKTRSTGRSSRPQPESSGGRAALMREDWLDAARRVLIDEGISAVKIDRLAKDSNVTRGGFLTSRHSRSHWLCYHFWSSRGRPIRP